MHLQRLFYFPYILYWSFLRNNIDQDIPSFSLRFHFPNRLNTNTFKSFLHGDITSKTIILDTKTIQTNFNKLKKNIKRFELKETSF